MRVALWVSILVPFAWGSPQIPLEPVALNDEDPFLAGSMIEFITTPQDNSHSTIDPNAPDHDDVYGTTMPDGHAKKEDGELIREMSMSDSNQRLMKGNSPGLTRADCGRNWWSWETWGCPSSAPSCHGGKCYKSCGGGMYCSQSSPICCKDMKHCCTELFSVCCEGDKCCQSCSTGKPNTHCTSKYFCCGEICCPKGKNCVGGKCVDFNWGK